MKKIILSLSIIACVFTTKAQSFEIGLKGGVAATLLSNANVSNAGSDQDEKLTLTSDFGLHLQYNFVGNLGIEMEFISEPFKQSYMGSFVSPSGSSDGFFYNNTASGSNAIYIKYAPGESYNATTTLNEFKIPVLFDFQAGGLSIELGAEWVSISNATYTATYTGNPKGSPSSVSFSTKSDFSSSNVPLVLGIGWNIGLTEKLYLQPAIRFEYGLTDLIGTDGLGQDLNKDYNKGSLYESNQVSKSVYSYPSYSATNSLEVNVNISLIYRIPMGD